MWRHIESIDIILLTDYLEFERVVALMAVNNQQPTRAYCPPLCMLIKVPQLYNTKLVCCLAVVTNCNSLIAWYIVVLVLGREVVLTGEDDEGWDCPPSSVDSLNLRNPLAIAWLDRL
jgi:hypothetical protein